MRINVSETRGGTGERQAYSFGPMQPRLQPLNPGQATAWFAASTVALNEEGDTMLLFLILRRGSGVTTRAKRALEEAFLPRGFPQSVSSDYVSYQIWDTCQAFASSITGMLATKAVLQVRHEPCYLCCALSLYTSHTRVLVLVMPTQQPPPPWSHGFFAMAQAWLDALSLPTTKVAFMH